MTAYEQVREIAALHHSFTTEGWNKLVRIGRYVRSIESQPAVFKKVRPRRKRQSAMDIAADACGLVKVRGALGGTYYE